MQVSQALDNINSDHIDVFGRPWWRCYAADRREPQGQNRAFGSPCQLFHPKKEASALAVDASTQSVRGCHGE